MLLFSFYDNIIIGDSMQILLLLAVIPSIIIAFLVYLSDRKEKEPIGELVKAFLLGILAVIITIFISLIFDITSVDVTDINLFELFIYTFISVALVEELSKWLVGYILLRKNNNFNYMYDGIVYYSFIALGFATVENILYALSSDLSTVLIRAVTTVPAHVFFGIACGYYFALSIREKNKGNQQKKNKYLILSIIMPIILHGFYDFCLLTGNYVFLMIFLVFVVSLYVISLSNARKMQRIDHMLDDKDMHCRNCGKVLTTDICSYCGHKNND